LATPAELSVLYNAVLPRCVAAIKAQNNVTAGIECYGAITGSLLMLNPHMGFYE
jgi:hypothetical protein